MPLAWLINVIPLAAAHELLSLGYIFSDNHGQRVLRNLSFVIGVVSKLLLSVIFSSNSTFGLLVLKFDLWRSENLVVFVKLVVLTIFGIFSGNCFPINVTQISLFSNLSFWHSESRSNFQLDLLVNYFLFVFIAPSAFLLIMTLLHILKYWWLINFIILLLEFTIHFRVIFCD